MKYLSVVDMLQRQGRLDKPGKIIMWWGSFVAAHLKKRAGQVPP